MNDQLPRPDEDDDLPVEDHDMPTRRVDRVDPDMLGAPLPVSKDEDPDPLDMAQPADDDADFQGVTVPMDGNVELPTWRTLGSTYSEDMAEPTMPVGDGSFDPDPLDMAQPAPDDDPLAATRVAGLLGDDLPDSSTWQDLPARPLTTASAPTPARSLRTDDISGRSYDSELPYSVAASDQPPVYGGFEDRKPKRRRTARERRDSGLYLPWWSLLILLAVVAFFAAFLFMGLNILGGQFSPGGETPIVIVITSTPTRLPVTPTRETPTLAPLLATPTVIAQPPLVTAFPTAPVPEGPGDSSLINTAVPTLAPTTDPTLPLELGARVVVVEVGEAGLNVREGPGTGFEVLFIAAERAEFDLIGGPEENAGLIWWQVREVGEATREGWTAEDYLDVLPQ